MKTREKYLGIKHKTREERKRKQRIGIAATVVILIATISVSSFIADSIRNQPITNQAADSGLQPKAAIIDQLSLTYPNQAFTQTATNTLKQAGYSVDYYPGEEVTVEFFRNLPTHGYRIIILREHSSVSSVAGGTFADDSVCFFTSEGYSRTSHAGEQLSDQLAIASYTLLQPPYYFAITPKFVTSSMKGNFQNSTVVMMGCEGLSNTKMAEAFIEKGAKVYVGWSEPVLASQTDQATAHLLQHLILEKQTVRQAVDTTMKEVGPDTAYSSTLRYYPLESSDYSIQR